jgi:hypothetical protein
MSEADRNIKASGQNLSGNIVLFIIKTCIIAVVISACTVLVANLVIESVEGAAARTISMLHQGTVVGGRQFWVKLENELDRAAAPTSDLSPETKQKLINDVRVIVARWRPFIDAVQNEIQKPANAN